VRLLLQRKQKVACSLECLTGRRLCLLCPDRLGFRYRLLAVLPLDQPLLQVVESAAPKGSLIGWEPDKAGIRGHAFGELIEGEALTSAEGFSHGPGTFGLSFLLKEDHIRFRFAEGESGLGLFLGGLQSNLRHSQALLRLCLRDFLGGLGFYLLLALIDLGLGLHFLSCTVGAQLLLLVT